MALASATEISGGDANTIPSLFFDVGTPTLKQLHGLSQKDNEKIEGEDYYVISGKLLPGFFYAAIFFF